MHILHLQFGRSQRKMRTGHSGHFQIEVMLQFESRYDWVRLICRRIFEIVNLVSFFFISAFVAYKKLTVVFWPLSLANFDRNYDYIVHFSLVRDH